MRVDTLIYAVLALTLAATPISTLAAQRYEVSATLSHNGKTFGSPRVIVEEGSEATVSVSGPGKYTCAFNVLKTGQEQLTISTHLASKFGSIAPVLVVVPGRPAKVSVGNLSIEVTAVGSDDRLLKAMPRTGFGTPRSSLRAATAL